MDIGMGFELYFTSNLPSANIVKGVEGISITVEYNGMPFGKNITQTLPYIPYKFREPTLWQSRDIA